MPIVTYVQNGQLVGYLPRVGARVQIPLTEIARDARLQMSPAELQRLSRANGETVGGAYETAVGGKAGKKFLKVIKTVAKSKVMKGIVNVVKKAVPPPFNVAVKAAEGAAKLGKALATKKKSPAAVKAKAKAKAITPAVRAAAAGKITSKQLVKKAKKVGIKPSVAVDAAVIKRVAMDARTNPQAAATLRLSKDLTDTRPARNARAIDAIEDSTYREPTTSRESPPPMDAPLEADYMEDDQAPLTEDPYGPDPVQPSEVEQAPDASALDGVQPGYEGYEDEYTAGYGYY